MIRCSNCGGKTSKVSIALCRKILGKNTNHTLCINCLSEYLEVSQDELMEMAEDFKKQGCELFE